MTSFVLKIIAISAMLIDHVGSAIDNNTMRIIGRLAFPIFAFQLAIGYSKTKNIKKYLIRLFIFAIISFIPYLVFTRIGVIHNYSFSELLSFKNNFGSGAVFEKYTCFNVLFTMFFAIIVLLVYDLKPDNFIDKNDKLMFVLFWIVKIILMSAIIAIVYYLRMDYGTYGILLILGIYISIKHGNKYLLVCTMAAYTIATYFTTYKGLNNFNSNEIRLLTLFTLLPVILMIRFNGKKGPSLKYLFYIIYPLQFMVLSGLKYFNVI